MSSATQDGFVQDSWQGARNARTLRAFMVLRNEEIAARIRELRGTKPQTLVAEEMGVAERTYQNWELGETKPSYRSLQLLANYFGVGEEFILTGGRRSAARPPREASSPAPDIFPVTVNRLDGELEDRIGSIEGTLAGIDGKLDAATSERQAIAALLTEQTKLLGLIEAATQRADDATARLDATAKLADRASREAVRRLEALQAAMPTAPEAPHTTAK